MAEIDEWMPWHIGAYLADTMHLSTIEHGAYLLILAHGWRNDGVIVANDANLAGIARMPVNRWKAIRARIGSFFEEFTDPTLGMCWKQKRQVEEITKAKEIHTKAVERSKKGNAARWGSLADPSRTPSGILQGIPEGSTRDVKVRGSSLPPENSNSARALIPQPGQVHHDRARSVADAYPIRSKDGRAVRKDLGALNLLATRIAAAPEFPWEEAAALEAVNDTPQDLGNWTMGQPDPLMLETRRKQKAMPPPLKPGERPRKKYQDLTA